MNCCNDFGQCTRGKDCPAGAIPFKCCPIPKKSPQVEATSDFFYFAGFVLLLFVICAAASLAWGLLERFYPSTACMILQLFSSTCK